MTLMNPGFEQGYQAAMAMASQKLGEPFDVGRDVIAVFGPRIAMYQTVVEGAKRKNVTMMFDLSSREAFETLWNKLNAMFPQMGQFAEFQDYMGTRITVR